MNDSVQIRNEIERSTSDAARALFRVLKRYWLVIPASTLLVAGTAAFWAVRQPKVYEASATFEYDPYPAQPLGNFVEDGSRAPVGYWETQELIQTQNLVLKSRTLAERVVRKLGLDRDSDSPVDPKAGDSGAQFERAVKKLMGSVEVLPVRETRVVTVRVRSSTPDRAQMIANAMVETYIEKSLEDKLGSSSRALEWLGNQQVGLKQELEATELALYKFREEHQSLSASLEERRKIIAGQLESYNNSLASIHTKRVQTESRVAVIRDLLATQPDPLSVQGGPMSTDEALFALRERYRTAESALNKLLVSHGPAHPLVLSARAEVETTHRHLTTQIEGIFKGVEADLRELERSEAGIHQALALVNQQGLELSLEEMQFSALDRERERKMKLYSLVLERSAQTDLTRAMRVSTARILDRAIRVETPVFPRVRMIVSIGIFAGLALGLLLAFGLAQLDNKIRELRDVEDRGLTVLGVVPELETNKNGKKAHARKGAAGNQGLDLIVHLEPRSTAAECCRTIRTNITFMAADRPLRAIAVTSALPQDGKTTVAINLAITLAQSGKRVLLIDTDLRKPRLHKAFRLAPGMGVTAVIAGSASLREAAQSTDIPGLSVLACGPLPPNPSELLHTRKFSELLVEARGAYDTLVLDTPPLGAVTDPAIISTVVDGTILVVRARGTTRAALDAAIRHLRGVSANILGVVVNNVDLTSSTYGTYYAYYRGYYADNEEPPAPAAQAGTKA